MAQIRPVLFCSPDSALMTPLRKRTTFACCLSTWSEGRRLHWAIDEGKARFSHAQFSQPAAVSDFFLLSRQRRVCYLPLAGRACDACSCTLQSDDTETPPTPSPTEFDASIDFRIGWGCCARGLSIYYGFFTRGPVIGGEPISLRASGVINKMRVFFIAPVPLRLDRKKPAPKYSDGFLNARGEGMENEHRLTATPHGRRPDSRRDPGLVRRPGLGSPPQEGPGQDADGLIVALARLVGGISFGTSDVLTAVNCLASLR